MRKWSQPQGDQGTGHPKEKNSVLCDRQVSRHSLSHDAMDGIERLNEVSKQDTLAMMSVTSTKIMPQKLAGEER